MKLSPEKNNGGGDSGHTPTSSLGDVARRYFFFGWLFHNAGVGDPWLHNAARTFNIGQRRYLPIYIRRWSVIFLFSMGLGTQLERIAQVGIALVPYVIGIFALCYVLIASGIFLTLEAASRDRRA
jgi:hypothetical protein